MWDIPFLDSTVSVLRMQEVTPVWDNMERLLLCGDEIAYVTYDADVLMQVGLWRLHPVIAAGFEVLDDDGDPMSAYIRSLPVPAALRALLEDIQREHEGRFLSQPELEALYGRLCGELESSDMESTVRDLYEKAYSVREQLMVAWHGKLQQSPRNMVLPVANENQRNWRSA